MNSSQLQIVFRNILSKIQLDALLVVDLEVEMLSWPEQWKQQFNGTTSWSGSCSKCGCPVRSRVQRIVRSADIGSAVDLQDHLDDFDSSLCRSCPFCRTNVEQEATVLCPPNLLLANSAFGSPNTALLEPVATSYYVGREFAVLDMIAYYSNGQTHLEKFDVNDTLPHPSTIIFLIFSHVNLFQR